MMRRRALCAASMTFTTPATIANVGDVAYWDGSKVKTTPLSSWSTSLGTPVGVVVVPTGFAPDGKARIVSLTNITADGVSTTWHQIMAWESSSNYFDTALTNYGYLPLTDNTGSANTDISGEGDPMGWLPSDYLTGTMSFVDPKAKYGDYITENMIPSPYLGESPNPEYYKTITGNNALCDFNGLSNTQTLVNLGSDYTAANAAWKYKDGASNLQWYLPSIGELGYIMPRYRVIDDTISALNGGGIFDDDYYWSSTEFNSYIAYFLYPMDSYISVMAKDEYYYVRPFAILDDGEDSGNGLQFPLYLTFDYCDTSLMTYCYGEGDYAELRRFIIDVCKTYYDDYSNDFMDIYDVYEDTLDSLGIEIYVEGQKITRLSYEGYYNYAWLENNYYYTRVQDTYINAEY